MPYKSFWHKVVNGRRVTDKMKNLMMTMTMTMTMTVREENEGEALLHFATRFGGIFVTENQYEYDEERIIISVLYVSMSWRLQPLHARRGC